MIDYQISGEFCRHPIAYRPGLVKVSSTTMLRPDLALVTAATKKLWLAAEIIIPDAPRMDTVLKKQIYEELNVPRLWMIDPRYDNVKVYHATEYGLALRGILAGQKVLNEKLLPEFQLTIADLFQPVSSSAGET